MQKRPQLPPPRRHQAPLRGLQAGPRRARVWSSTPRPVRAARHQAAGDGYPGHTQPGYTPDTKCTIKCMTRQALRCWEARHALWTRVRGPMGFAVVTPARARSHSDSCDCVCTSRTERPHAHGGTSKPSRVAQRYWRQMPTAIRGQQSMCADACRCGWWPAPSVYWNRVRCKRCPYTRPSRPLGKTYVSVSPRGIGIISKNWFYEIVMFSFAPRGDPPPTHTLELHSHACVQQPRCNPPAIQQALTARANHHSVGARG
mmetsp:Transcript_40028/g.119201  ORF Transcript_40028/g.119201 Transcript_40028/m.119201 type:complete len:258 (+) Transcript_40028:443-1216(+)